MAEVESSQEACLRPLMYSRFESAGAEAGKLDGAASERTIRVEYMVAFVAVERMSVEAGTVVGTAES